MVELNNSISRIQTIYCPPDNLARFFTSSRTFSLMQLRRVSVQQKLRNLVRETIGDEICQSIHHALTQRNEAILFAPATNIGCAEDQMGRLVAALGTLVGEPYSHWDRGSAVFRNQLHYQGEDPQALRRANWPDPLHTDTMCPSGEGESFCVFGCVRRVHCIGGESELLYLDDWQDLPQWLQSPYAWEPVTMQLGDSAFAGRSMTRPIFSHSERQELRICWSPRNILPRTKDHADWLEEIRRSLIAAPRTFSHALQPGEVLIFDNRRWLHGRCPIQSDTKLDRLLLAAHVQ